MITPTHAVLLYCTGTLSLCLGTVSTLVEGNGGLPGLASSLRADTFDLHRVPGLWLVPGGAGLIRSGRGNW